MQIGTLNISWSVLYCRGVYGWQLLLRLHGCLVHVAFFFEKRKMSVGVSALEMIVRLSYSGGYGARAKPEKP